MRVSSYYFHPKGLIQITLANGQTLWVRRDTHSGRMVTRLKINTVSEVQHTGIWLGQDYYTGEALILHNHYQFGTVHISTLKDYALGQQVYWQAGRCQNSPERVLQIALREAQAGTRYDVLLYNCQHYTNRACHNRHYSPDLAQWGAGLLGVVFIAMVARAVAA